MLATSASGSLAFHKGVFLRSAIPPVRCVLGSRTETCFAGVAFQVPDAVVFAVLSNYSEVVFAEESVVLAVRVGAG
jgi:hypothetical protein